ncbi:run domain Beclin-1-interacting and cysteine-rich domain-containing protein isoform X2 [Coccinella septempunctata]|uniref:run domain Beclin-1-interacting and cysteine-rich domain-containing protein isoform X2 n=1 Tax=Coccinella septempunctata TaxID=41139 RepID=UPI001D079760|nr:run domain Beclin-1-interacting and cysteine-rich domain-containing protein isoform X2 [Coccinella septempunctata]
MPKSLYTLKHEQLLRDLKNTIDGLLSTQVANVWSIYGGLNRLHSLMDKIFKHGCKLKDEGNGTYYNFLEGLEWLQPNTSTCFFSIDCEYQSYMPTHLKDNKAAIWLYKNLENLSLSTKLGWLLSDKGHLGTCYYTHAFLCSEEYSEAVLICLKALERNQPTLMAEINPCLFLLQPNARDFHKLHRRCSSFPDNYLGKMESKSIRRIKKLDERHSICNVIDGSQRSKNSEIVFKLKPWSSTPNLFLDKMEIVKKIVQSKTVPTTPTHNKKKVKPVRKETKNCTFFNKKKEETTNSTHGASQIMPKNRIVIDNKSIVEYTPSTSYSSEATITENYDYFEQKSSEAANKSSISVVDYSFRALPGEKDYQKTPKKSFIEGGGKTILPMSTGYIPTPVQGQSLLSFLTSSQLTRSNAQLDRENAHFNVSEAIISAIEQMNCKKDLRLSDDPTDDSDPEILELKQRIRIRRRQKMVEKQRRLWASSILIDGGNETTSASPPSSSSNTYSETSSDNIEDIEIDEASNLAETKGLSNSMASLYSEADLKKTRGIPDGASDILSAESVAISLISTFKGKRLPKASELQWLVSEEDAPQALLPMPKGWPVNPDDHLSTSISLRGTDDWAPPRPQIIFTLHPSSTRKELMIKQNYRCAGCGMRVAPQYASKFRYCEYLGRYFCTGCHSNQLALIPARILHKWDFTRLPVSTFSYRLLEQMYSDPLFRIFDLNKNIGKFSKDIEFHRKYSLGLYYLKDFILSCDDAESVRKILKPHIKSSKDELELYSLEDLVKIKSGQMKTELKNLVDISIKHITECQICMGRGHICELCKSNEVIFPWQLSLVTRCDSCGCCYHKNCWKVGSPCKKCIRLNRRRESKVSTC